MSRRKRKSGIWHHRAPDFKLVYCGPEESFPEKTIEFEKKKSPLLKKQVLTKDRIRK